MHNGMGLRMQLNHGQICRVGEGGQIRLPFSQQNGGAQIEDLALYIELQHLCIFTHTCDINSPART